jgi:hypothetical protein
VNLDLAYEHSMKGYVVTSLDRRSDIVLDRLTGSQRRKSYRYRCYDKRSSLPPSIIVVASIAVLVNENQERSRYAKDKQIKFKTVDTSPYSYIN